jgi:cytochrome c peroxidase
MMRDAARLWCAFGTAIVAAATGCERSEIEPRAARDDAAAVEAMPVPARADSSVDISPRLLRRFQPIAAAPPPASPVEAARATLGRRLFEDRSLSADGTVACSSCHDLSRFGTDGSAVSTGIGGRLGSRNAPTVFNAGGQFRMFWDGRAASLEEQAKGPILNPAEMGMPDGDAVTRKLRADSTYRALFAQAFPADADAITFDNFAVAVAAFERTLVTRSRWDAFLEGDEGALDFDEKRGLKTFLNAGCMVCHTGKLLGGSMYERVGVVEPWPNQADLGRYMVTKDEGDRMMFKVPSLRNVAGTAPYFHDGSAKTLDDAVRMMGRHQLGLELSDDETKSIVVWLKSLTGTVVLPPQGDTSL